MNYTYQIVLCGLCISHDNKHLVVHILIGNRLSVHVAWCLSTNCIVLDLEASIDLTNNNHWFGLLIDVLRFGANGDEFNVIFDPQYLATSLSLYIFLGNVF